MRTRIFAVSTTTHTASKSTSVALLEAVLVRIAEIHPKATIRAVDANSLHIVQNLSCYANGKRDCANPESGPYRCWAHQSSVENPAKYGGVDQMPVIYDGLAWADTVIWATSTRWGSHSALMQKIIERMDTLENRAVSWGEPNPLRGKRCGVLAAGLHWKTDAVADHLQTVFRWYGFDVPDAGGSIAWQRTDDPYFEHPDPDKPYMERWLSTRQGQAAVDLFSQTMLR